jgi:hypothetical protein
MACGTYSSPGVQNDSAKNAASANVIFKPVSGCSSVKLPNTGWSIGGSHVEFHGVTMDQTGCTVSASAPNPPCPSFAVKSGAHDVVMDGIKASRFYITGAFNVTVQNSDFGPSYDSHGIIHADSAGNRPHDILLDNISVHDHWNTTICKGKSGCVGSNHMGCGPTINDSYRLTVNRSRFFNCEDLGMLIKPYKFPNDNITLSNNWFGPVNGPRALSLTASTSQPNTNLHILNNTFAMGVSVTSGVQYKGSEFIGNLGSVGPCSALQAGGFTLSDNVVSGSTSCGSNSIVTSNFGLASDGIHLLPGSPAIGKGDPNRHPPSDIDGQSRPSVGVDAGADQH